MKKLKPKSLDELNKNKRVEEVVAFCKKIKYGEIYESSQIEEHFIIGEATIARWRIKSPQLHPYMCCLKTAQHAYVNVFVSEKYKQYLISTGKALERHPNHRKP